MEVLKRGGISKGTYQVIKVLDAVAATTTSDPIVIAGAKKITLFFTRTNHSAGSTAFSATVSADNSTFITYNKLITNAVNSISEGLVRVASVSLSSNTTSTVTMDLEQDAYYSMKLTATETTDGNHTIVAVIEY